MGASRHMTAATTGVSVGDITDFDGGTKFTHVGWYKFDSLDNQKVVFSSKRNTSSVNQYSWWIYFQLTLGTIKIEFSISSSTTTAIYRSDDIVSVLFNTDDWFHVAYTVDVGSTPKMYVNGIEKGMTQSSGGTPSSFSTNTGEVVFGGFDSLAFPLLGRCCYHQLFTRVLSNDEIVEIMHRPGSIRNGCVIFLNCLGNSNSTEVELQQQIVATVVDGATDDDGPPVYFPDLQTT